MSAADLVRAYGLKPDDLVVHSGAGGVEMLRELRVHGCRVLRLDPDAVGWDGDIDTLRVARTPAVERVVRERYGSVAVWLTAEREQPASRAA